MIKFDQADLTTGYIRLKHISTAMGGSVSFVDEDATAASGKEVIVRETIGLAVARDFIMRTKITKYLKPVTVAVIRFRGYIICMERHPLAGLEAQSDTYEWKPQCFSRLAIMLLQLQSSQRTWYVDGRYVYALKDESVDAAVEAGRPLTASREFRALGVDSYDLQRFSYAKGIEDSTDDNGVVTTVRTVVAFIMQRGTFLTPPIWRSLDALGTARTSTSDDDEDPATFDIPVSDIFNFDEVDSHYAINLNFVLKAGADIGSIFGYEHVEPLQLPRLMIELHTVNLPALPLSVKRLYDCNMVFTHLFAWLMGLMTRTQTFEDFLTMRALLKYITGRGLYKREATTQDAIFIDGVTLDSVEAVDLATIVNGLKTTKSIVDNIAKRRDNI